MINKKQTPQIKGPNVLFTRYSKNGVNGVKQKRIGHASGHAPEKFGLWVFLGGFEDLYLAGPQFKDLKQHGKWDSENGEWSWDDGWNEKKQREYYENFKRRLYREIWWDGPVYGNIDSHGNVVRNPDFGGMWFLFPSARDYVKAANRILAQESAYKKSQGWGWGNDHFECFLPGKKF